MIVTQQEREKLEEKLSEGWQLSQELFGDPGCDIHDFMLENYTYFINHVDSVEKLREGLRQLSPITDDALKVAESMSEQDFAYFKENLPAYREGTKTDKKYGTLLIPNRILAVGLLGLSERYGAPDGAVLVRLMETMPIGDRR